MSVVVHVAKQLIFYVRVCLCASVAKLLIHNEILNKWIFFFKTL
jgi:hypothetical protein